MLMGAFVSGMFIPAGPAAALRRAPAPAITVPSRHLRTVAGTVQCATAAWLSRRVGGRRCQPPVRNYETLVRSRTRASNRDLRAARGYCLSQRRGVAVDAVVSAQAEWRTTP